MFGIRALWRVLPTLLLVLLLLGLHTGCLEVPLGDSQTSTVDPQFTGWWEDKQASQITYASAFDAHAYLITQYSVKDDGGERRPGSMMQTKSWLTHVADMDILTCKMVDPRWELQDPADVKKRYSFYRVSHDGASIKTRRLNEELLGQAKTPEGIAKLIEEHAKKDDLWDSGEPEHTWTAIPDGRRDELKRLLDQMFPN